MESSKKAAFVKKFSKKRLKLKREYFEGGGIAGLIGAGGGLGGTGFNANSGTTAEQINNAYNQNQAALQQQGSLANTLSPQAASAVGAQNTLSNQYAQQAQGGGPNVAQNMLAQSTGQNVAQQAALMAGQRGASANPALLARQAAQQGAATQQQAAGQGATLQAQQQIAAEQAQAQLAGNQIAQAQGAVNANTGAQQAEQGVLQGANTANNNITGNLANTTLQGQQGVLSGIMNGAGAALGLAHGGEVGAQKLDFVHKMTKMGLEHHNYAHGGNITANAEGKQKSMRHSFNYGTSDTQAADTPPQASPAPSPSAPSSSNYSEADRVKAGQDYNQKMYGSYADGGAIEVPGVSMYQTPGNPFAPPQEVQGGFTAGPNAGAEALGNSMKGSGKKDKKSAPMGTTSDPTNPNITGANNPLVASGQASVMPTMTGEALPVADIKMAAHGGVMHPHFQGPHKSHIANYLFNKGGPVPAMVSPGEVYLSPDQVHKVIHEDVDPAKIGHHFKGKAKVKGDSRKNDTIPTTLQEGGVVVDRKNMGSPEKRKLFVHRAIAKKKAGAM